MRSSLVVLASTVGFAVGSAAAADIDAKVGAGLATRTCAGCHDVGPTTVHMLPPAFGELAQSPATTEASLEFLLTHPHYAMPNIQLSADERGALIAYILSLRQQAR